MATDDGIVGADGVFGEGRSEGGGSGHGDDKAQQTQNSMKAV
jgi:hypothetical protein